MQIVSLNVRTLLLDQILVELEEELEKIKQDIVGLNEVRRIGGGQVTLKVQAQELSHLLPHSKAEHNV